MAIGRATIEVVGDVSKFAPGIAKALTKGFAIAGLGAAAAATTAKLIPLANSIAAAAGAALSVPAAAGAGAAALTTLGLAVHGMGDAMGAAVSGDVAKFDKAIENLSPAAKTVAKELAGVAPELRGIQQAAQEGLFSQLVGQVGATARALAGPLRSGAAAVATEFGRGAATVAAFARDAASVQLVADIFGVTQRVVASLLPSIQPVLVAARDVAAVGVPFVERMTAGLGPLITEFATWVSSLADSGRLLATLDAGFSTLAQLGRIAAAAGGIVVQVFQAASAQGSNALSTIERLVQQLAAFLNTATGAAALRNIFTTLATFASTVTPAMVGLVAVIGGQLAPILGTVITQLGPALAAVVDALAPVVTALGPALTTLASAVTGGVAALAPALRPIAQALAMIVTSVAPLLPLVGQLATALVNGLFPVVMALRPALDGLVTGLLGALGPLLPVLVQLGQVLGAVLLPVATQVGRTFATAGPAIGALAAALAQLLAPLLEALGPLTAQLVDAMQPLLPAALALVPPVVQLVVALTPLIALVAQLLTVAVAVAAPLIRLGAVLAALLASRALVPLLTLIARALTGVLLPVAALAGGLGRLAAGLNSIDWARVGAAIAGAFSTGLRVAGDFVSGLGEFFVGLPERIGGFLAALPQQIGVSLGAAFDAAVQAVGVGIGLVLFAVLRLPGLIVDGLFALPGLFTTFFSDLWASVTALASTGVQSAVDVAASLSARTMAALDALPELLGGFFTRLWTDARNRVVSGALSVVDFVASVPDRIGALGGFFTNAGQRLIAAFMNGLRNVGSFIGDVAGSIVGAIKGFLNRVIGNLNAGIARVDDVLPGDLPRIPFLAAGGIINRRTLAVLGEAGSEVVLPLTRPRRALDLAQDSGLLDVLAAAAGRGDPGAGAMAVSVRVFLGDREITDIVRVEVDHALDEQATALSLGPRAA